MPFIAITERLELREMTPSDAVHAFHLNNDPEVLRHTGDDPFTSIEAARSFLASYTDYQVHGFGRWAVVRREDGAWLGWCGLKRLDDGQVDLGYRLMRTHWGRGYATEAGRCCLRMGFDRFALRTIIGRVAPGNNTSIRVLEKLGFHYWRSEQDETGMHVLVHRIDRPEP